MWNLGEKRYIYASVTSTAGAVVISAALYQVFDTADETVVISGVATISGQILSFLWEPSEEGRYVAQFDYDIGSETFKSSQVIEVRETM